MLRLRNSHWLGANFWRTNRMKTTPFEHQKEALMRLSQNPERYALGMDQGTGKTWCLMADAEQQFQRGLISGLLVIAPKGVHVNWVRREIPYHMEVPTRAGFWLSGAGVKHKRNLEKVVFAEDRPQELAVLAVNVDAVNTEAGRALCERFLEQYRCMMVVDESQRIKSPTAKRTKAMIALGRMAVSRRIASGTLVANSPLDLFSQYEFLEAGLLGTTSFRAFTAEYAELLPAGNPLVETIRQRSRMRSTPQVVARTQEGAPKFRNLEKLHKILLPFTFRVLKEECLDLPDKIYQTHPFELSPAQRKTYDRIKEDLRFERSDGEIDTFTALTIIGKLRQVTSGFIMVDGEAAALTESGPRLAALKDILQDLDGQIIVWASFVEEIKQLAALFEELDIPAVTYFGATSDKDREDAIDDFQDGKARVFIGNPSAAGTGLTLTAAKTVVYYSNSYSLEQRLQSEDRAHRIGVKHPVLYIDLVGRDTIDEPIARALQTKKATASAVLDGVF